MNDVFINGIGSGGGFAGLNFQIVGETSRPARPKENTIWVNTNNKITGWIIDTNLPSTAPPEGTVFIGNGLVSNNNFNALKKNEIHIYPLGCKQYLSGQWISKTAETYKDGVWNQWIIYCFKNGKTDISVGSWVGKPYNYGGNSQGTSASVWISGSTLNASFSAQSYRTGGFRSQNKINVSGYNNLTFKFERNTGSPDGSAHRFGIIGDSLNIDYAVATGSINAAYGDTTKRYNVDISKAEGEYYIFLFMLGYGYSCSTSISEIILS